MNRRLRIRWKLFCILVLAVLLAVMILFCRENGEPEYSGEMVFNQDMQLLTEKAAEYLEEDPETIRQEIGDYTKEEDWYEAFDQFRTYHQLDQEICKETIDIIGGTDYVRGAELKEKELLAADGRIYVSASETLNQSAYVSKMVYRVGDTLYAAGQQKEEPVTLLAAYLEEADETGMQIFYKGYELYHPWGQILQSEQIATLIFCGNDLVKLEPMDEVISGRTLQVGESEVVLEDKGSIPLSEEPEGYYRKEELRSATKEEIPIGYEFTDYAVKNGQICAFLILPAEQMEYIRIAISRSDYQELYHEKIILKSSEELLLSYTENGEKKEEKLSPSHKLTLTKESRYLLEGILKVTNPTNSGKTELLSVQRSQGIPSYRGNFEIHKTSEGLFLINELPLEEYLYAVVPSEMPSTYPPESLKAQAVCARTYSYRYLECAGLPSMGAHVDDSVNYQVYNNIMEKKSTSDAVRQTEGEMLLYEGKPIMAYYYSTSYGYGTDDRIWKKEGEEASAYLQSVHISEDDREDYRKGSQIEDYLTDKQEGDYEKEEPWYRWKYQVEKLDLDLLKKRMKERGIPFSDFDEIKNVEITKRGAGGIAELLVIDTGRQEIEIAGEYEIRYLLNQGGEIVRQDGSTYPLSSILPSAYFILDTKAGKNGILGFALQGGGFGHGVGMSQNAAKAMALSGKSYQEILSMFYRNCQLAKKY